MIPIDAQTSQIMIKEDGLKYIDIKNNTHFTIQNINILPIFLFFQFKILKILIYY